MVCVNVETLLYVDKLDLDLDYLDFLFNLDFLDNFDLLFTM